MRTAFFAAIFAFLAWPSMAQEPSPISVSSFAHRADGVDHILEVMVRNTTDKDLLLKGRFVVINVYDTSLPANILIEAKTIKAGASEKVSVRWSNTPLFGKARALAVLSVGQGVSSVESYDFWVAPVRQGAVFLGAILGLIALTFLAMRLPILFSRRSPSVVPGPVSKPTTPNHAPPIVKTTTSAEATRDASSDKPTPARAKPIKGIQTVAGNYVAHIVEYDDTVVSLSNRFGVTWQDIVKANRMRPPYTLKVGKKILLPKHALKPPETQDKPHEAQ